MITQDDATAGFVARWTAAVTSAVTGGLWLNRADPGAYSPYAVLAVEPKAPEHFSGGLFVQDFIARVNVYANVTDAVPPNVIQLAVKGGIDFKQANVSIREGTCLVVRPIEPGLELDPELRNAQDVCVSRFAWQLTFQGNVVNASTSTV